MARRSNFSFERMQRDCDKAAKREAKRVARPARKGSPDGPIPPPPAIGTASTATCQIGAIQIASITRKTSIPTRPAAIQKAIGHRSR